LQIAPVTIARDIAAIVAMRTAILFYCSSMFSRHTMDNTTDQSWRATRLSILGATIGINLYPITVRPTSWLRYGSVALPALADEACLGRFSQAQPEVRGNATRSAFRKWENEIKRGLECFGITSEDPDQVATTVLSQLEGAPLLARTYRSPEPLQRAGQALLAARAHRRTMSMGMGNGAQERTRTFTAVKPLAPEASASTNSTTWARAG
jgi:hypothetical protein